jgi:hypothetical protein
MQHVSAMNNKNLICSGHRVSNDRMSAEDLVWANNHPTIQQDEHGRWFHTMITERDRKFRRDYWNPDTGPWRKGVNY